MITVSEAPVTMEEVHESALNGPVHKLIRVTPELAQNWLDNNTHNRALMPGAVREYSVAMQEGRWRFDGDAIRFSSDNVLLDGQHRLWGVVRSNTAQVLSVWFGLAPEVQNVIDTGRKRSFQNVLELSGEVKTHIPHIAAVTPMLYSWEQGARRHNVTNFAGWMGERPQNEQLLQFFRDNQDEIRQGVDDALAVRKFVPVPARLIGLASIVFRRIDNDDAAGFMKQLAEGIDLEEGSPILMLRNRLLANYGRRNAVEKLPAWIVMALIFKSWNLWRDGELIKQLSFKPGGAKKENYPDPH